MSFLGDLALMLLWICGGILLTFGTYVLVRKLLPPRDGQDGHHYPQAVRDMATTTGLRIAALFGILLALVYAQELRRYQDIRDGLTDEAVAISQVYFDAGRLGGEPGRTIRAALSDYVRLLVRVEWPELGKDHRLSGETWDAFNSAQDEARALLPADPRETAIRDSMVSRLASVSELRNQRERQAVDSMPWLFAIPAIMGLLLVTTPFFIYPPGREVWVMLGAYGAFAGLILFFIHAFASPFGHPLKLAPAPFERMLAGGFGQDVAKIQPRKAPNDRP
ncbi:DUF4239 domain-containing protein [Sandaracinobacter neustonicus]|uniref:DUF4239 domain-containing protein n=1 Tax=Sandaracinobacter neustonicus TaxID=1715348 RepID=A0A501XNQ4_9SPHN|nr:DUF4239 domain-containing protein [Sandaracinobacter neustonicus]TPE62292.1 DUF4239 domain-containing protein [Sandaracinobacter neustonicus]